MVIVLFAVLIGGLTVGCGGTGQPHAPRHAPSGEVERCRPTVTPPWAEGLFEPVEAASLEIVLDEERHYELEAFDYDPQRIEASRYDGCVSAGVCPERISPHGTASVAVGMTWLGARSFCESRGMRVQSADEDILAQELTRETPIPYLEGVDPALVVVYGFRCTRRARRLCSSRSPQGS